ncbi:ABC transporter permease [Fusobacterium sp. PH5-44]|uniref:ABC transporter permease n=1 Tax=unclassified Fusobacterium TaxID=2648384 RepID=UPI003D1C1830
MNLLESFKSSIQSLFGNKIRSILTMLGIIIGITSVITMSGIGQGAQQSITGNLKEGGYGKFTVSIDKNDTEFRQKYMLNNKILQKIKDSGNFKAASPSISARFFVKVNGRTEMIFANVTNEDFEQIDKVEIIYGRNILPFEYEMRDRVVTIDHLTATSLFGDSQSAVGQNIELASGRNASYISYKIVGVYKNPLEQMISIMGGRRIPRYIRLPINTYDRMFATKAGEYSDIIVEALNPENLAGAMSDARALLYEITGIEDLYEISTVSNAAQSFDEILSMLNIFVSFVAGISLLVGGIGVMNIMLVSVIERTKEVGIRKAIGATNRDIMMQFLLEAIILTGLGGIIGIILGISFGLLIGAFIKIPPVFKPIYVLGSMFVSMFIGIIFGVTPAKKAANLNTVEALRSE